MKEKKKINSRWSIMEETPWKRRDLSRNLRKPTQANKENEKDIESLITQDNISS